MKIRLSKKFVLIVGGIMVLCGGSGAAAVFVGTDKLLGPSYLELNGLECTTLKTEKITRNHRVWVRKYVLADKAGDGMARIRTALRVARAVQEREKADLVQVAMLDKAGPTERAEMRGRAIGAQVVYIADLSRAPEGAKAQTYSAYYLDGPASSAGEYFGLRIDLPLEDVEALSAKLTDKADCVDPVAATPEGEAAPAGHGGKAKPKKGGGGHGAAAEGAAAEGEAPAGEGHGAAPAEGHGAAPAEGEAAEGHGGGEGKQGGGTEGEGKQGEGKQGGEEAASKEGGGFLSSVTSMIFGSEEPETQNAGSGEGHGGGGEGHPAEASSGNDHGAPAEGDAAPGEGHAAPAEGHAVPSKGHGASAAAPAEDAVPAAGHEEGREDQPVPAAHAQPEGEEKPVVSDASANRPAPQGEAAHAEPAKAEEGGFFSSVKGMIFGPGEAETPGDAKQEASVDAKPSDNPPAPRTAAEGGKRWSSQDASDAVHSGDAPDAPAPHVETAPAPTDGTTAADAAGAAWLAKFRAQQAATAAASNAAQPAH